MDYVQKKSIEHYERMIEWANTQDSEGIASGFDMNVSIGECWQGNYCDYCNEYHNEDSDMPCEKCPLAGENKCSSTCCSGLWRVMDDSLYWEEWLIHAEKILKYIKEKGGVNND